jgi:hypothetical protein
LLTTAVTLAALVVGFIIFTDLITVTTYEPEAVPGIIFTDSFDSSYTRIGL